MNIWSEHIQERSKPWSVGNWVRYEIFCQSIFGPHVHQGPEGQFEHHNCDGDDWWWQLFRRPHKLCPLSHHRDTHTARIPRTTTLFADNRFQQHICVFKQILRDNIFSMINCWCESSVYLRNRAKLQQHENPGLRIFFKISLYQKNDCNVKQVGDY